MVRKCVPWETFLGIIVAINFPPASSCAAVGPMFCLKPEAVRSRSIIAFLVNGGLLPPERAKMLLGWPRESRSS